MLERYAGHRIQTTKPRPANRSLNGMERSDLIWIENIATILPSHNCLPVSQENQNEVIAAVVREVYQIQQFATRTLWMAPVAALVALDRCDIMVYAN